MAYKNGEMTREKILKGSKELFLSEGYVQCTYKKIGAYLGINSNLITYYFSNKQTLAKYVLVDFFEAESKLLSRYINKTYPPMLVYALQNRIHYQLLARDLHFLKFYSEVVSIGLLHEIFFQIPNVKKLYDDFFSYYKIKQKFDEKYLTYLELGSEREILLHFTPELATDENFMRFITSIFPSLIHLPENMIEEALVESKKICQNVNYDNFKF